MNQVSKQQVRPILPMIHSMARTGSTLISRCLGCMHGHAMLSEINPKTTRFFSPIRQANDWYGFFTPTMYKVIKQSHLSFIDQIMLVYESSMKAARPLIIRDWSHIDFLGRPFNKEPDFKLSTFLALRDYFQIPRICIVRHPYYQWKSMSTLGIYQGEIEKFFSLEEYLHAYRIFAQRASRIGYVRFEDFTQDPDVWLIRICQSLGLIYDPDYKNKWQEYEFYTGDKIHTENNIPGAAIQPFQYSEIPADILSRLESNPHYHESLALLGYDSCRSYRISA